MLVAPPLLHAVTWSASISESYLSYERGACKRCEMIGISVKHFILPVNCTQEELLTVIRRINEDGAIHGCLLFRPLPRHLDEAAVYSRTYL